MNTKSINRTLHALVAFILAMMLMLTAGISNVHAANVCNDIYGDCTYSETFNVTTGSGWLNNQSIKLTQTKGEYNYELLMLNGSKKCNKTHYGIYYVTVIDQNGNYLYDHAKWKSKSMCIKLQKNSSYDITVEPETNDSTYSCEFGGCYKAGFGWKTLSTWKVSRTKHCTFCAYN